MLKFSLNFWHQLHETIPFKKLMTEKEYIIIILFYVSLTTSDMKHLFICLITIWICSSVNFLFMLSTHVYCIIYTSLINFLLNYLHFTDINPLSDIPMPSFP